MPIEEVRELYELNEALLSIRKILADLLDDEAVVKNKVYKRIAELNIKDSLSFDAKLIALKRAGEEELTKSFIEVEKDVAKAKNAFRQAEQSINIKKHINNLLPKQ